MAAGRTASQAAAGADALAALNDGYQLAFLLGAISAAAAAAIAGVFMRTRAAVAGAAQPAPH
jgi:hypothetical protein